MTIAAENKESVLTLNNARTAFYNMLASLYYKEVTAEQLEAISGLEELANDLDDASMSKGLLLITSYLKGKNPGTRQELAVDYASTFLGAGHYEKQMAVPFESIYTSENGLLMQEARDDVFRIFCSEHIGVPDELGVPEDHISFECWFMVFLIERMNEALNAGDLDAAKDNLAMQCDFHRDHLANWVDELCDSVDRVCRTDFYRGVAEMTRGFIAQDATMMSEIAGILEAD